MPHKNAASEEQPASITHHTLPWPAPQDSIAADRLAPADIDALRMLAAQVPPGGLVVEIGTLYGGSAVHLCGAMPKDARFVTIDTYGAGMGHLPSTAVPEHMFVSYVAARLAPYRDRAHIVVGDSVGMAALFSDESADLVFIDGAHDYTSVMADLRAWMPKVKPDGWVAGHDFEIKSLEFADEYVLAHSEAETDPDYKIHFGVSRALRETFDHFECDKGGDSTVWRARLEWTK